MRAAKMSNDKAIPGEFNPGLFHPFYFIRKGLYRSICANSHELTGNLMDFGCGSKPYQNLFKVDRYVGVDYYNEGHPHENEQIDVFYDGKQLPFADAVFDSVLCSEVFEHVFNIDPVLKEINRVVKKGGKILITCPFVWNEHETPHDYARYTRFALQDMLERNGFEMITFSKSGNFVIALSQAWILYFSILLREKSRRFFLSRWIYKLFFVLLPNLTGLLLNALLPANDSLYLNNIVLACKVK